jgi:hypothetical protein
MARFSGYQRTAGATGLLVCLGVVTYAVAIGVPAFEAPNVLLSGALLASPYALLASQRRPGRPLLFSVALILITAGTVFGIATATTSSTGPLIFLWLLPLHGGLAALGVFVGRRTHETPPPAGWYPDPWRQANWRFWDGTSWTAHAKPR